MKMRITRVVKTQPKYHAPNVIVSYQCCTSLHAVLVLLTHVNEMGYSYMSCTHVLDSTSGVVCLGVAFKQDHNISARHHVVSTFTPCEVSVFNTCSFHSTCCCHSCSVGGVEVFYSTLNIISTSCSPLGTMFT
ncbi:unnamed protein product [Arctogadus glacialis]